jgi:nucleoside-triphosphatase
LSGTATARHVLLITGRPGVGKTTLIQKVAASLPGRRLAGFYTEEIRVAGRRTGFRAVTFDGRETIMAHTEFGGPHRVGRYGVDVSAIDAVAQVTLASTRTADVYLVDEIGKMECLSSAFVGAMRQLLALRRPVMASVGQHGGGFIAEVKDWPEAELWEITRSNRNDMPERALAWLARHGVEAGGVRTGR